MNLNDLKQLLEIMEFVKMINSDVIEDEVIPGITVEEFEHLENNLRFEILKINLKG